MLEKYKEKRDFEVTAEPGPSTPENREGPLTFVIQRHNASHLHYDFRLEVDGVLKSWAVPKGPSLNPADKRLAVMTEDHPIEYATFEGSIPKGQYGGGEVIVWDRGTYSPDEPETVWNDRDLAEERMREGLKVGKLSVTLRGQKMRGSWAFVRTKRGENQWLLLKHRDGFESTSVDILEDSTSVVSHLTTEDIASGKSPVPVGAKHSPVPSSVTPMLAVEEDKAFDDEHWAFEVKLDGIRVIAIKEGIQVKLLSRNQIDITEKFPAVVSAIEAMSDTNLVLDGEIVMLDDEGKPSFQKLMERFQNQGAAFHKAADKRTPVIFYLFDILHQGDYSLMDCSFNDRRRMLDDLAGVTAPLQKVDSFEEVGKAVYDQAIAMGFEGVVAKRRTSTYQQGKRTGDWKKIKSYHTGEFWVVGYMAGKGARKSSFGSLLLASFDSEGQLKYNGNVGGGFNDRELDNLLPRLEALKADEPTVEGVPRLAQPVEWVQPKLVVEVRYMNKTTTGSLRAPTFLRMRPDLETMPKITNSETIERATSSAVADFIEELNAAKNEFNTKLDGMPLKFTSLDKVLWPAKDDFPAYTKRDLVTYLATQGDLMLPHLKDRPLAFVRYPDGLGGEHFFQKHWEKGRPEFVDIVPVWSGHNKKAVDYILCHNLATLLWLAQLGTLELHPWQSKITPDSRAGSDFATESGLDESVLNRPDYMVLDLDPYTYSGKEKDGDEPELNEKGWRQGVEVALALRSNLEALGIKGFLKCSGKTGIHIFVPLDRIYTYDQVRAVAETLGRHILQQMPDLVTMEWSVKKRPAKVFFDHNQNIMGKTLAAAYSTRPAYGAPVSMPLEWDELAHIYPTQFNLATFAEWERERQSDPWADIFAVHQTIG